MLVKKPASVLQWRGQQWILNDTRTYASILWQANDFNKTWEQVWYVQWMSGFWVQALNFDAIIFKIEKHQRGSYMFTTRKTTDSWMQAWMQNDSLGKVVTFEKMPANALISLTTVVKSEKAEIKVVQGQSNNSWMADTNSIMGNFDVTTLDTSLWEFVKPLLWYFDLLERKDFYVYSKELLYFVPVSRASFDISGFGKRIEPMIRANLGLAVLVKSRRAFWIWLVE